MWGVISAVGAVPLGRHPGGGGHQDGTQGLTLPGRREAHGLGERSQHRLFRQPEAQPSAQGSGGERKGSGLLHTCPALPSIPISASFGLPQLNPR